MSRVAVTAPDDPSENVSAVTSLPAEAVIAAPAAQETARTGWLDTTVPMQEHTRINSAAALDAAALDDAGSSARPLLRVAALREGPRHVPAHSCERAWARRQSVMHLGGIEQLPSICNP
ncbi:hypothetical protein WJX81_001813 [Elliptochloris bilobata]|uniref:Uncharacterized protein n=1 Tax=Elliptochloris bilobata TaxID=381761 RepID=A0AAW1SI68_9CHLO